MLARWFEDVGFDRARHGHVRVGHNGPSGAGLVSEILTPLRLLPDNVAFTDAVPWYFVKHGSGSQGAALEQRFRPFAELAGVHAGSLPPRPTPRQLPAVAAGPRRRASFRSEILDSQAPLVITLGQEALDALVAVVDASAGLPARLEPATYGRRGEVVLDARGFEVLPLVHPGFIRQTQDPAWREALAAWAENARS